MDLNIDKQTLIEMKHEVKHSDMAKATKETLLNLLERLGREAFGNEL